MVAAGSGGRIVNVTSVHEHVPLPESVAYVAAKHALGGVTKQLALELGPRVIAFRWPTRGDLAAGPCLARTVPSRLITKAL